ncbi:unnamed protein product [Effrenium voratum]|uniref:Pentatricopeptide repeat-containing protein, chloroplastic n=1 Tax=Effrenium voratum TaxID=2562239 RepID=A0AA36MVD4_9DINO|nr:unnamed protein product [Effrenium voratum]
MGAERPRESQPKFGGRVEDALGQLEVSQLQAFLVQLRTARTPIHLFHLVRAMSRCSRSSAWQSALSIFRLCARKQQGLVGFNAALAACGKGGQWQQAARLLEAMGRAQLRPSVVSFGAAIDACAKAAPAWPKALHLLREMRRQSLPWNTITCNAAMSSCAVAGQWLRALQLFAHLGCGRLEAGRVTRVVSAWAWPMESNMLREFALRNFDCETFQSVDLPFQGLTCSEVLVRLHMVLSVALRLFAASDDFDAVGCGAAISACEKGAAWRQARRSEPRATQTTFFEFWDPENTTVVFAIRGTNSMLDVLASLPWIEVCFLPSGL